MWLPNCGLSTGENLGPQTRLHLSVLNLLAFWAAFRPGRGEGWGSSHWRRQAAVVLHSDRKASTSPRKKLGSLLTGAVCGWLSKRLSREGLGVCSAPAVGCLQKQARHRLLVGRVAKRISVSLCMLARRLCQPLWRARLTCWRQAELGTTPEIYPAPRFGPGRLWDRSIPGSIPVLCMCMCCLHGAIIWTQIAMGTSPARSRGSGFDPGPA